MPATIAQKILARAAGKEHVRVNEIVTARVDLAMANDITGPLAVKAFHAAGATRVFDAEKICIFAGRHMPFPNMQFATDVSAVGRFCAEQGIRHFYADGEGMDHAAAPELGLFRPGMLVLNADSHACTAGALGTFAIPMGSTDMAYVFAFGESWLLVPGTIRVCYSGKAGRYVTSKDLVLATMKELGVDGARYKVLEFCGDALYALEQDERFTIANMAIEMGAKTAVMEPDAKTDAYLRARTQVPYEPVRSDPDAEYEATVTIDAGTLAPQVARPFLPSNVVAAAELTGTRITQVTIGTCTNGRLVDLEQAAEVLRGRKVAKGVRLIITPASAQCYQQAMKSGLIELFMEAGATVNPPGCGPCAGIHQGVLNASDVCVATHNRNFRGRMGHRDAQIYLASPYVAAASAVAGTIADPREVLQ
jgi:3-isopropylmalate/(R)-2-methylmalate dehydratase large subunit